MKLVAAKKAHYDSGPNMTPMVDIVMVILIFFMLGASFIGAEHFLRNEILISGEGVQKEGVKKDIKVPPTVRIDVRPGGETFEWSVNKEIKGRGPEQLLAHVAAVGAGLERTGSLKETQAMICPDPETKYEYLVQVYQAVNLAKFEKIGMGQ